MTSHASYLTRPPHAPPPISVGAIRSDRPRQTNLARGRLGRSFLSTVCLSPFFCYNLTRDIRLNLCAESRGTPCPGSPAVVNFHLHRAPPITPAALLQLPPSSRPQTPRNHNPSSCNTSHARRPPGPFDITTPPLHIERSGFSGMSLFFFDRRRPSDSKECPPVLASQISCETTNRTARHSATNFFLFCFPPRVLRSTRFSFQDVFTYRISIFS